MENEYAMLYWNRDIITAIKINRNELDISLTRIMGEKI
jgi:hypothetical protein